MTKFNTGDWVYGYSITKSRKKKIKCDLCDGTTKVCINGTEDQAVCPRCNYRGFLYLDEPCCEAFPFSGIVGKIAIEYYGNEDFVPEDYRERGTKVTYMLAGHGIGSGRVFDERDLFATKEAADANLKKTEGDWVASQHHYIQQGGKNRSEEANRADAPKEGGEG